MVEHERLFKSRTCRAKREFHRNVAQVQFLRSSIRRAQQTLRRASKISSTRQIRFRRGGARSRACLNKKNARMMRDRGEKLLLARGIKLQASIQRQHEERIHRRQIHAELIPRSNSTKYYREILNKTSTPKLQSPNAEFRLCLR